MLNHDYLTVVSDIITNNPNEGYEYYFTHKTYFLHIIPPKRLEESYLQRLFSGIGHGMYLCDKQQKGNLKTIFYAIKNCLKIIYKNLIKLFPVRETKKLRWHYKSYTWKAYIKCALGDAKETEVKADL